MKKAHKWINNCKNRKARELLYLLVPEQHKDGAWHIHGLLCNTTGLTFTDSGKRYDGVENREKIELVTITGQSILEKYISEKLETINIGSVLEGIYIKTGSLKHIA